MQMSINYYINREMEFNDANIYIINSGKQIKRDQGKLIKECEDLEVIIIRLQLCKQLTS
jgi:hypothetical protein